MDGVIANFALGFVALVFVMDALVLKWRNRNLEKELDRTATRISKLENRLQNMEKQHALLRKNLRSDAKDQNRMVPHVMDIQREGTSISLKVIDSPAKRVAKS